MMIFILEITVLLLLYYLYQDTRANATIKSMYVKVFAFLVLIIFYFIIDIFIGIRNVFILVCIPQCVVTLFKIRRASKQGIEVGCFKDTKPLLQTYSILITTILILSVTTIYL